MDITKKSQFIIRTENASKNPASMSKFEMIAEQYHIIRNWKPWTDVWPLTFGRGILMSAAMLTGFYINQRFRAKLKYRQYGGFSTILGITISTCTVTALCHTQFVLNKIILLEIPCSLCLESTSALMQTFSGLFLPLIITPIANFSIGGSDILNVPYITDVRKIFGTIMSVYKPLFPKITMIFTLHALLAGFITYLEIKSFLHMLDLQYLIDEEKKERKRLKLNNIL